jgi:formylglycine-generating enzyme required for sulfatase activity
MGCEQDEATPIHSVTLSPFTMSNTHVTQGEYMRVMGINPSEFSGSSLLPVESVTWFDAVLYCNKRSKMEQKDTVYSYTGSTGTPGNGASNLANITIDYTKNGYRLPTEAEWEYACEAGTTSAYYWGGSYPPKTQADTIAMNNNAVWYLNSNGQSLSEGVKLPNAWGLYDMVGNVWSWLNDWNGKYTAGAQTNPTGPAVAGTDRQRIARGSSWSIYDSDYLLRSAIRNGGWHPDDRSSIIGFRVVHR